MRTRRTTGELAIRLPSSIPTKHRTQQDTQVPDPAPSGVSPEKIRKNSGEFRRLRPMHTQTVRKCYLYLSCTERARHRQLKYGTLFSIFCLIFATFPICVRSKYQTAECALPVF